MKVSVFSPIRCLALHLYLGWWSIFNFCQVEVKILFMPMDIQSLCHHFLKTFFLLWNAFAASSKISLVYLKMKVLVTQLCLTLCDPMDSSPPGSSDPGILQARILEWVAISFSKYRSGTMLNTPYISFISQNNSMKMYHRYLHFIERKIGA